jgi:hypothetical protein
MIAIIGPNDSALTTSILCVAFRINREVQNNILSGDSVAAGELPTSFLDRIIYLPLQEFHLRFSA